MVIDTIRALLGKKTTNTATLAAARDGIDIDALSTIVEKVRAERSAALLEVGDAEVAKIEERLAKAQRDLDRGRAARDELARRIEATAKIEALAEFRATRALVDARADGAARALRERYPALASELRALLAAARDADMAVCNWNQARNGSEPEAVAEAELRPIEHVEERIFDGYQTDGLNGSYWREVVLPNIDPSFAPTFNDFRTTLRGAPLKLRGA